MTKIRDVNIETQEKMHRRGFYKAFFSNNFNFFLFFAILILILVLPNASAISEITTLGIKTYNEPSKTYSIKDYLGLTKIVDIKLVENTDYCTTECYAIISITPYADFKVGRGYLWQFYNLVNMKEVSKGNILKEWGLKIQDGYYNESIAVWGKCESINGTKGVYPCITGYENIPIPLYRDFDFSNYQFKKGQEVIIRLEGTKNIYARIEWIPTFAGYRLDRWAPWDISQIAYYTFDVDTNGYFNDSGSGDNNFDLSGTTAGYYLGVSANLKNASNYTSATRTERATANITNFNTVETIDFWFIEKDIIATNNVFGVSVSCGSLNSDVCFLELDHSGASSAIHMYSNIPDILIESSTSITATATAGIWHHVVITGFGTKIRLYIDNVNVFNDTDTGMFPAGANLTIGNLRTAAHYAVSTQTSVDNVFLSASAYTVADVAAAYNSGAGVYYGAPLTTTLNSPTNGLNTTNSTIYFNCSADIFEGLALQNITLYGNWSGGWHANETKNIIGNATNSTIFTKTFSDDGSYKWNCLAYDTTGNYNDWGNANWTFNRDTTAPIVMIVAPIAAELYNNSNVTFNYYFTDAHPNSSCWYSLNSTSNITLNACANTSIITSNSTNRIDLWSNDTSGNTGTATITFDVFGVSKLNYTSPVSEWDATNFYINITANMSRINANASFSWNQTFYTPTKTQYANLYEFHRELSVPALSASDPATIPFFFNLTIGRNVTPVEKTHNSSGTQSVNILLLDNCTTYSAKIFNFTYYDEVNNTELNIITTNRTTTFNALFKLGKLPDNTKNFSFSRNANQTSYAICINTFYAKQVDASIEYLADGYKKRDYQILNNTITNGGNNITFYLLDDNSAPSAATSLNVKDENYEGVQNVYIKVLKYYLGLNQWVNVSWSKATSVDGETLIWLISDENYKFEFWKDYELFGTQEAITSSLSLTFTIAPTRQFYKYGTMRQVNYTLSFDNTTNITTMTFDASAITPSTDYKNITLRVEKRSVLSGNPQICSNTSSETSGILTCNNITSTGTYYAVIILQRNVKDILRGNEVRKFIITEVEFSISKTGIFTYFREDAVFMAFILIICFALAGLLYPPAIIMLALVGFVFSAILGLIEIAAMTVITIVIVGFILFYKMRGTGDYG